MDDFSETSSSTATLGPSELVHRKASVVHTETTSGPSEKWRDPESWKIDFPSYRYYWDLWDGTEIPFY